MVTLILASQSPRRRALISLLGLQFHAIPASVDEESVDEPDPKKNVLKTALLKARTVSAKHRDATVIAADTTVAVDDEMLGKPANAQEAWKMLRRLRGRAHQVHTGLTVIQQHKGHQADFVCTTDVVMRTYTDDEIEDYIDSGDPFDKAGSYAIQHGGFRPVTKIRGCYSNVVGLPLCQLRPALLDLGIASSLEVAERTRDHRRCVTCQALMNLQNEPKRPRSV